MKKSPKKYVVGYFGKGQDAIYSKRAWAFPKENRPNEKEGGVELMTLFQAKRHLKVLLSDSCTVAIFKIVPVLKIKKK